MRLIRVQRHPRWVHIGTLQGLLVSFSYLCGICCSAQQPSPDYTSLGPCSVTTPQVPPLQLPKDSGCGFRCTLDVHVTAPAAQGSSNSCTAAPYPVVVLFNGFQLPSSYYSTYARHLASWAFAVVQYDLPLFTVLPDDVEVGFFGHMLHHLYNQSAVSDLLDLSRVATAGHSRGGKLAALQLADNPQVLSAFLIDPVDSTGPGYPSAAKALAGLNKQLGITAAGVSGPCNPIQRNYHVFWDVAGRGSWLEQVPGAGHLQFANISSIFAKLLDLLCKVGHDSRQEVLHLTMPTLIAWLEATLRANTSTVVTNAPAPSAAMSIGPESQQQRRVLRHQLMNGFGMPPGYVPKMQSPPDTVVEAQDAGLSTRQPQLGSLQAFFDWVHQQEATGAIEFRIK